MLGSKWGELTPSRGHEVVNQQLMLVYQHFKLTMLAQMTK